jgi:hypothetical protein
MRANKAPPTINPIVRGVIADPSFCFPKFTPRDSKTFDVVDTFSLAASPRAVAEDEAEIPPSPPVIDDKPIGKPFFIF